MIFWTLCALAAADIRFERVAGAVPFTLAHHPTADKHMVETMPGGLAVFDFDNDGRLDLFFANGAALPALRKEGPKDWNRLYRNEGNWKFSDVTEKAGLRGEGYALGAAAGDFDGDGFVDLFVAGLYRNALYRNKGDGTFEDVTAKAGILSDEWSVAGGWFDYDNDGRLDLLVTNYGRLDLKAPRFCGDRARNLRIYCHPKYYDPRPNQLYRNKGGGVFENVTELSGLGEHRGRGMSIAFADYDADGRMDAFVTNDNLPNFLFRNLGNGRFEETALLAGVALLDHGRPVASMGTDFRDADNDGRPDIVVTALSGETFPFFKNGAGGAFTDAGTPSQLARLTNRFAGWGVQFGDLDNDGHKDLFTANSHVNDLVEKFEAAAYRQPNTVFRNQGGGKFALAENTGLETAVDAHRGLALADLDNDGRLDAVVTVLGAPVELWRNVTADAHHWIAFRVPPGTRVSVGAQHHHMSSSVSYASSVQAPLHFGVGAARVVEKVEIVWPGGRRQTLENLAVDRVHSPAPLPAP